jgi:aspartate aminotransferase
MHPAMIGRLKTLATPGQPFADGVVQYTTTAGTDEAQQAFLNVIASSGFATEGLHTQITDGGSQAMELVVLGVCGPAGGSEAPLLLIDPAYTNYRAFAERLARPTVNIARSLAASGRFTLPALDEIATIIKAHRPGGLVVIPYDNPTGQFYDHATLVELARLCVEYDAWLISDEAYRELHYVDEDVTSIWGLTETEVPGIRGRRISIETTSKVWNACGLRIGALVTDNRDFHDRAVAENTASLCPNIIGQHILGALAHESHRDLQTWYGKQRAYYKDMALTLIADLEARIPGLIVSQPSASIYSVVDVRDVVKPGFDALDFVLYCASAGKVAIAGVDYTLLTAPMAGFYSGASGDANPGRTQMRIAYVEPQDRMALVPQLLAALLEQYEGNR